MEPPLQFMHIRSDALARDVLSVGKGQVSCLLVKRGHQLHHNPSLDFEVTSKDTVILCGHRENLVKIAPGLVQ